MGVADDFSLLERLGHDFREVKDVYCGPELRTFSDGSWEGYWGEIWKRIPMGRHGEAVYPDTIHRPFKNITSVDALDRFRLPSVEWFDYSTIKEQCERWSDYAVTFGNPGHLDLINGVARSRGVEQVLIDIAIEDPVYLALMDARFKFFYGRAERALQAGDGFIDIVRVGEDLATQRGLLISPAKIEKLFVPKYKAYFDMVHRYGALVMMHSCGSVRALIPRLIEMGLDILDVVQPTAVGMDIRELAAEFGDRLCFAGSMCVQTTLPHGTVDDVCREVRLRQELFPDGGLILGPTHHIQIDTPLENILAMYRCAGSLQELVQPQASQRHHID
ncbi:MAG: hypothetical protein KJ935_06915 [Candidatus Omnitrophica bacterium]|nr:hypothetical protein [Candidatus Omnitrophota bacterium]